jgi:alpha/beta superfamily hydrolase
MRRYPIILALLIFPLFLKGQNIDTIFIQVGDLKLHTVLTSPTDDRGCPLAIIIAGSGPTDLNGNQPNMCNNSLKYLAEALVENNIATLRFDKRGVGKSKSIGLKEADLTIDRYADDLVSIINYFKGKGYSAIYVIGHSEGSLIGLIAVQKNKISGFVSIAGAGNSADEILKKQLRSKLPQVLFTQVETIIDSLKNCHLVKQVPPQFNSLFRPSVQPYLISWFKYNPTILISDLNCPLIIIQGDKDIQVDVDEANILVKASQKGKLIVISNMNHVLKTINGEVQENLASYSNPDLPINPILVKGITDFITKNK